jgi:hypothetical protein
MDRHFLAFRKKPNQFQELHTFQTHFKKW